MMDKEGKIFDLEGVSAQTSKLIVPSTVRSSGALDYYCVITDKKGNRLESEHATLDIDNQEEYKPVFYVCEYAILLGSVGEPDYAGTIYHPVETFYDLGDTSKPADKLQFTASGN